MSTLKRLWLALTLWRTEGYDDRPTPWRMAWDIAGVIVATDPRSKP
jgi:hypothetical protein